MSSVSDVSGARRHQVLSGLLALAVLCAAWLALAQRASAARDLDVGFADYLYGSINEQERDLWLDRTVDANADIVRVNLYWSSVATSKPSAPRDPSDPAYNFQMIDNAVRGAEARGLDVELTVLSAPPWAEGGGRPRKAEPGTWKPDPRAYGDFAHAVAVRYSGAFPAASPAPLPVVEYYQAWNETNLDTYLAPQWKGKRNRSADIYVPLLNEFHDEVKAVNPEAEVVAAGTAPYGDPPGGPRRTQPLRFFQEMLCLDRRNRRGKCPKGGKPKADIFAHHPINREDPPREKADFKGDVEIADVHLLAEAVRKAEKLNTIATPGKHPLWADEVWWQTDPPDRKEGITLEKHARWTAEGLYLLWKQGVSKVIFLQFRDAEYRRGEHALASYQTGVYTYGGEKKPSYDAVRFPFVTEREGSGNKLRAWGVAPESGELIIEAKRGRGGYQQVGAKRVSEGKVFTDRLRAPGGRLKLRATVGGERSSVWVQGKAGKRNRKAGRRGARHERHRGHHGHEGHRSR
ncbi:MAG: hypothetical protein BroJett022_03950 [Actinomycetes bacterium]|nr:MAG: hypothetical protein BroJett022_03950 [Actinomycetes bacterium]